MQDKQDLPYHEIKPTEKSRFSCEQIQKTCTLFADTLCPKISDYERKLRWYCVSLLFAPNYNRVFTDISHFKKTILYTPPPTDDINKIHARKVFIPFCKYFLNQLDDTYKVDMKKLVQEMKDAADYYQSNYPSLPKGFIHYIHISEEIPSLDLDDKPDTIWFKIGEIAAKAWNIFPIIVAYKFLARMYLNISWASVEHLNMGEKWKEPNVDDYLHRALKYDRNYMRAWYFLGHVYNHKDAYVNACECYAYAVQCSADDDIDKYDAILEEAYTLHECENHPMVPKLLAYLF